MNQRRIFDNVKLGIPRLLLLKCYTVLPWRNTVRLLQGGNSLMSKVMPIRRPTPEAHSLPIRRFVPLVRSILSIHKCMALVLVGRHVNPKLPDWSSQRFVAKKGSVWVAPSFLLLVCCWFLCDKTRTQWQWNGNGTNSARMNHTILTELLRNESEQVDNHVITHAGQTGSASVAIPLWLRSGCNISELPQMRRVASPKEDHIKLCKCRGRKNSDLGSYNFMLKTDINSILFAVHILIVLFYFPTGQYRKKLDCMNSLLSRLKLSGPT